MLYNKKTMLKLCKELGIEIANSSGYSMVKGVEIDINEIETLFKQAEIENIIFPKKEE